MGMATACQATGHAPRDSASWPASHRDDGGSATDGDRGSRTHGAGACLAPAVVESPDERARVPPRSPRDRVPRVQRPRASPTQVPGHVTVRDPGDARPTSGCNCLGVSFCPDLHVSDLLLVDGDGRGRRRRGSAQPAGVRDPLGDPPRRGPTWIAGRARPRASHGTTIRQPGSTDARSHHAGRMRLLRGPRRLRRIRRRRPRQLRTVERLGRALGDGKAMIHQNHGLITVGTTLDEAALVVGRHGTLVPRSSCSPRPHGTPTVIPAERRRDVTGRVGGSHYRPAGSRTSSCSRSSACPALLVLPPGSFGAPLPPRRSAILDRSVYDVKGRWPATPSATMDRRRQAANSVDTIYRLV